MKNSEVWTDDEANCIIKTDLKYLLELYPDEYPIADKYIWNEDEKWVIESPVVNADYDFSVNFGYSDSYWKLENDRHFAEVRKTKKVSNVYIDLTDKEVES